jgi:hypothetical protein
MMADILLRAGRGTQRGMAALAAAMSQELFGHELKRYGGDNALGERAARANGLTLAGDNTGEPTWRRIMSAVKLFRQRFR